MASRPVPVVWGGTHAGAARAAMRRGERRPPHACRSGVPGRPRAPALAPSATYTHRAGTTSAHVTLACAAMRCDAPAGFAAVRGCQEGDEHGRRCGARLLTSRRWTGVDR